VNQESKVIVMRAGSAFQLNPAFTSQEAIALRALVAGQTDRQVCRDLFMHPTAFLRMMRDIREKIGARDNVSVIEWVKHRIRGVDQRIDKPERYARIL